MAEPPGPAIRGPYQRGAPKQLEEWLKSYRPEELFDADGRLRPDVATNAPSGNLRMSATPHANGGLLRKPLKLPAYSAHAVEVQQPEPNGSAP